MKKTLEYEFNSKYMDYLRRQAKNQVKQIVKRLDHRTFEFFIGEIYDSYGADVSVTQATNDGGVDINSNKSPFTNKSNVAIECKRFKEGLYYDHYKENIPVNILREYNSYEIVTTAERILSKRDKKKLKRDGYGSELEVIQLKRVLDKMSKNKLGYLVYIYDAVCPSDYEYEWEDFNYIKDRWSELGLEFDDKAIDYVLDSETDTLTTVRELELMVLVKIWYDAPEDFNNFISQKDEYSMVYFQTLEYFDLDESQPAEYLFGRDSK